jgi:hypothetical protein
MHKTNGKIQTNNEEHHLFTYDEGEVLSNKVNKANAKLVFSPKFLVVYPKMLDELTPVEVLIYSFINYYSPEKGKRFYFTNQQIADIVRCSSDKAGRAINKLEKEGYIKTSRKIKSGGGQIRFITQCKDIFRNDKKSFSNSLKNTSQTRYFIQTNNSKINNNKYIYSKPKKNTKSNKRKTTYSSIKDLNDNVLEKISQKYSLNISDVKEKKESLSLYCESKGKKYRNYKATLENWLRKDLKEGRLERKISYYEKLKKENPDVIWV